MNDSVLAEKLLEKLYHLHRCKYAVLKDMQEATSESIFNPIGEIEKILKSIEIRQGCIDKIDVLDVEIYEINEKTLSNFTNEDRQKFAGKIQKIDDIKKEQVNLIEQMIKQDREYNEVLGQSFKELKGMRDKVRIGRQTMGAYLKKHSLPDSIFVDEKK
ncbi:MAG: hypothetical protein JL50_16555 [Peptococcaceae bacterium BICA1-7]|nr:MAG: hypothetical protein JL50_16555 [Peptococcaceae bacterium BICA1-7]HBV96596.1 hypothetical protein [Desulfotomaculum sp.]